jgi:hypothetical protein
VELDFSGGGAHALSATDDAGEVLRRLERQQGFNVQAAQARILMMADKRGEGAIALQDGSGAVKRDHTTGDGFDDGLELAASFFDGLIGRGELRRRRFSELATGLKV